MTENELKVAIADLKVIATRFDSSLNTCAAWLDALEREVSDTTDLRAEFYAWMVDVAGKSPKTAKDTSRVYVPSISDDLKDPTIHIWHGLREALYGTRATKSVYDLRSVAELRLYYTGIEKVLGKTFDSADFDADRYQKCWDWAHNPANHNSISAGWNLFTRFMTWRDSIRNSTDVKTLIDSGVRFWTYAPGAQASYWDDVREDNVIALSYKEVGDFSKLGDKDAIVSAFQKVAGDDASHKNSARAVIDFRDVMKPGDYVFAKKGMSEFLGVGRVIGNYFYDDTHPECPNRRAIEWLKVESRQIEDKADRKTLTNITPWLDFVEQLWRAYGLDKAKLQADGNQLIKVVDRLICALELFKRLRSECGPNGWTSYDAWAKEARAEFTKADAGMFVAAGFDYAEFMRKFLYSTTVANSYFKDHTDADKNEVGNFISQNRNSPQAVSWYLDPANKPNAEGMNACVMLNLMTMVRPAEFALYAPPIDHMLVVTGVAKDLTPKELTVANYEANKALQGQVLAKMNELGIGKAADDDSAADFLTVGEFAWWISDETNLNLVKEKIMSTVAKEPKGDCAEDGKKSIVDALKDDVDSMMSRLTAALLTKPFAILAGASGTGKSRMVKKLAYMTCRADMLRSEKDETPGNYCMIAVKPNWHDSSDLLGYRSAFGTHDYVTTDFVKFVLKAHAFPNTPFFVCLDEMNLAPVEQYFAEYLSSVESVGKNSAGKWTGDPLIQRGEFGGAVANLHPEYQLTEEVAAAINDKGLFIPQNLFVVGTVNMDDTTNQFSRKVLDRAMTIMMNEVDFATLKGEGYEKLTNELRIKNEEIEKFIDRTIFSGALMDGGEIEDLLNGVRLALQDSPFEVGYRYAIETVLYREAIKIIKGKSEPSEEELKDFTQTAIDHTILMKILPRITGTLTEREEVLKKLEECFGNLSPHKLSADTLKTMKKTADNNGGYISFWP